MKKIILFFSVLSLAFVFSASAQDAAEEVSTNASFYLQQAQTHYVTAQKQFETGEYDLSTESANKARAFADQYRKSLRLRNQFMQALRLIDEAEILILQARQMKATEEDLQPSLEKLDEARSQYERRNFEAAVFAARESISLTRDLLNRLRDSVGRIASDLPTDWKTYKVRLIPARRDCLWRIAEYDFVYKNPRAWPVIWKANKDQIVDPDLIFPGQVFKIPPLSGVQGR